jgi:hypothetical protein
MAAVSTNYGTAGDSTLESNMSRSRETKDSSKSGSVSGSGSNSNSASRSMSQSRVQRKRAGTGSHSLFRPVGGGSGAGGSTKNQPASGTAGSDASLHVQAQGKNQHRDGDGAKSDPVRVPMRRSLFAFTAPRKKKSFSKLEKGKNRAKAGSEGLFPIASDLIELVPRPHIRPASGATEWGEGECADRMVIHKEVRYSIQYENEVEVSAREELKNHSVDISTYV